jgi:hypothetical protein
VIPSWNYENLFGFATGSYAPAGVVGSNPNPFTNFSIPGGPNPNPASGYATKLSWGGNAGYGQSSLTLSGNTASVGQSMGTVLTSGPSVLDLTLTHRNVPIYSPSLESAVLVGSLMLQANAGPYAGLPVGPLTGLFSIMFKETPNEGACTVPSATQCRDIFVIDQANSSDLTNVFLFALDGANYFLDVDIEGLSLLSNTACAAAGLANAPCLGFSTEEGQSTDLALKFRIRAVPEPGVLALLGLGFGRIRRSN